MTLKSAGLLFFVFLGLTTATLFFLPGHNGDMPFYIAAVFENQGMSEAEAFSATKAVITEELPEEEHQVHLDRLNHAGQNNMAYYRIKPLYIFCIQMIHYLGVSLITATLLPSLASYFLIGVMVFAWAYKVFKPLAAVVFSIVLMLLNPSIILARLSSPDPISNLLLFLCFYRIYFQKKYTWTVLILLITLFVRLDNFISVIVLLTVLSFGPPKDSVSKMPLPFFLASLLLVTVISLLINVRFESNFWWFGTISYIQSPLAYGKQVMLFFLSLSQSFFPALLLLALGASFYIDMGLHRLAKILLAGIFFIFFFRFLLFPSFEERFNTSFYLSGFLILLDLLLNGNPHKPYLQNKFS